MQAFNANRFPMYYCIISPKLFIFTMALMYSVQMVFVLVSEILFGYSMLWNRWKEKIMQKLPLPCLFTVLLSKRWSIKWTQQWNKMVWYDWHNEASDTLILDFDIPRELCILHFQPPAEVQAKCWNFYNTIQLPTHVITEDHALYQFPSLILICVWWTGLNRLYTNDCTLISLRIATDVCDIEIFAR